MERHFQPPAYQLWSLPLGKPVTPHWGQQVTKSFSVPVLGFLSPPHGLYRKAWWRRGVDSHPGGEAGSDQPSPTHPRGPGIPVRPSPPPPRKLSKMKGDSWTSPGPRGGGGQQKMHGRECPLTPGGGRGQRPHAAGWVHAGHGAGGGLCRGVVLLQLFRQRRRVPAHHLRARRLHQGGCWAGGPFQAENSNRGGHPRFFSVSHRVPFSGEQPSSDSHLTLQFPSLIRSEHSPWKSSPNEAAGTLLGDDWLKNHNP